MRNRFSTLAVTGLLTIFLNILPFLAMAQDPGPCPDCPIDGGLCLLLAAGVGYGVKDYRDRRKRSEDQHAPMLGIKKEITSL